MSRRLGRDITAAMSNNNIMAPPATSHDDPFVATPPHAHPSPSKLSHFDSENAEPGVTADAIQQTRKTLERYLKDTDKRIQEASTIGTSLLQSRKKLVAQIQNISEQNNAENIGPELQSKLIDIEREHAALSKETARAFNNPPKLDSSDAPMSPAVFTADTRSSPSKVAAPSRRQRNQPSTRIHDIEFATEISTSLLAQVRQLQTALADKDDLLRQESSQRSKLETDVAALRQRMRAHDDNEQRFKDENWGLETQLQTANNSIKTLKEQELRMTQSLRKADQANEEQQRVIDDLHLTQQRIEHDQAAAKKQHDSELHELKRDLADFDDERSQLHERIDDLVARNDELASSIAYKAKQARKSEQAAEGASSDNDSTGDQHNADDVTPPASPSKNARAGILETETLKSSLQHAHRMIQNLKNNIHREKTDKLELKRMLQDLQDELISRRDGQTGNLVKKRRSEQEKEKRKPVRADQLGAARHGREDITMEDPEWIDHDDLDPIRSSVTSIGEVRPSSAVQPPIFTPGEETSDAFETANEREATETEHFATSNEKMSEDDGDLTETDTPIRTRPSIGSLSLGRAGSRASVQSTASVSENEGQGVKTPIVAQFLKKQKYKLKLGQRGKRYDRHGKLFENSPSAAFDSPAVSLSSSARSTPVTAPRQTLGDELAGLSDDETVDGTPSQRSIKSAYSTPDIRRTEGQVPVSRHSASVESSTLIERPVMVDSATMTEPMEHQPVESGSVLTPAASAIGGLLTGVAGTILGRSRDESTLDHADGDRERETLPEKTEASSSSFAKIIAQSTSPVEPLESLQEQVITRELKSAGSQSAMALSEIISQHMSPKPQPKVQETLTFTESISQQTAPVAHPPALLAPLSISNTTSQEVKPIAAEVQPSDLEKDEEAVGTAKILPTAVPFNFSRKTVQETQPKAPAQSDIPSPRQKLAFGDVGADVLFSGKEVDTRQSQPEDPFSSAHGTPAYATRSLDKDPDHVTTPSDKDAARPRTPTAPMFYAPLNLTPKSSPHKANTSSVRKSSDPPAPATTMVDTYRPSSAVAPHKSTGGDLLSSSGHTRSNSVPQDLPPVPVLPPPGSMGPPLMPASAYRTQNNAFGTARIRGQSMSRGRVMNGSMTSNGKGVRTRTSTSSFASEMDQRFRTSQDVMYPDNVESPTDPRMISAITQTMIGQDLWKYTRKAGRSELSSSRHRRWFWIHPYTRTLYWSEHDPATAGKSQVKSKSVGIVAVRTVEDTNTYPPGLYQKSIVVVTPGRDVVFTAPTAAQHDIWFNALSYLLLRTETNDTHVIDDDAHLSDRDLEEFNPRTHGARSNSRATARSARSRSRVSLSSYNSQPTNRTTSPQRHNPYYIEPLPTLGRSTPRGSFDHNNSVSTPHRSPSRSDAEQATMSSRITSFRDIFQPLDGEARTLTARLRRSLSPIKRDSAREGGRGGDDGAEIYNAQTVNESDPDALKAAIEQPAVRYDVGLENVRACCGGKHNVGSLSRHHEHSLGTAASLIGSMSTRTSRFGTGHGHGHGHGNGGNGGSTSTFMHGHGHSRGHSTSAVAALREQAEMENLMTSHAGHAGQAERAGQMSGA